MVRRLDGGCTTLLRDRTRPRHGDWNVDCGTGFFATGAAEGPRCGWPGLRDCCVNVCLRDPAGRLWRSVLPGCTCGRRSASAPIRHTGWSRGTGCPGPRRPAGCVGDGDDRAWGCLRCQGDRARPAAWCSCFPDVAFAAATVAPGPTPPGRAPLPLAYLKNCSSLLSRDIVTITRIFNMTVFY